MGEKQRNATQLWTCAGRKDSGSDLWGSIQNGYSVFEVPDGCEDCCFEDFDSNGFNIELYNARKLKEKERESKLEYENLIVQKIRAKYSLNEELAILRQRDIKPEEFKEYNTYVEQCKKEIKEKLRRWQ